MNAISVFLVILFSAITFAQSSSPTYAITRLLQQEGPINWVPTVNSLGGKQALFSVLANIVQNPSGLSVPIQARALSESGKFAYDNNGNLLPSAKDLYSNWLSTNPANSNDEALRTGLIQALKNAYIPESVSLLESAMQSQNKNSSLFAYDILAQVLSPDAMGMPPLPNTDMYRYDPRIGTPLSQRKRSSDWLAQMSLLSKFLDGISTAMMDPLKKQKIERLQTLLHKMIAQKNPLRLPEDPIIAANSKAQGSQAREQVQVISNLPLVGAQLESISNANADQREPASAQPQENSKFNWPIIIAGLLVSLMIALFLWKRQH